MDDAIDGLFAVRPSVVGEGRYALFGQLGAGAVAEVFLGEDRQNNSEVAIKMMQVPHGARKQIGTRFLAEAKVLAKLRHPHLPRVYDAGRDGSWYWFVMDLARSGSVAQVLNAEGAFPAGRALRIAFEVTSALHAVHEQGLIHRDVKPENVLLTADGRAMLADFGIARHPEGSVPVKTRPGQLMGTRGFRSPEQEDDAHAVGPGTDMYGIAATLYMMLTGDKPRRLWERSDKFDALDPALADLLRRGVSADPAARFESARDMALAIAQTADRLSPGSNHAAEWMKELDGAGPEEPPSGWMQWVRRWIPGLDS